MPRLSKVLIGIIMFTSVFFNVSHVLAANFSQSKVIPDCVLDAPVAGHPEVEGECRNINIYILVLLQVANYLFGIVGALALIFFIYGGFTLILSRGNAEQTSKGMGIISAAVIGLVIVFGAYMLVRFLGTAIGLKSEYILN
jgi:hypothetical protein